jgi:hypothetical protein
MIVEFKVHGRTKDELEIQAAEILTRFLEVERLASVTLESRVTPFAEMAMEGHPSMWEADVRAEV